MTKIKRKQLLLDIENAPDGHYGIYPGGNVPDVQPGDQLEEALDKIIETIDRMAPQQPPALVEMTFSVTENVDGPVGPTGVNDLDGNTVSDVYRYVNGELLTYTTTGNPNDVENRDGHFGFDAVDEAILRFRHIKVNAIQTKIADIDYLEQLIDPPIDDVNLITDTTDGYDITTNIAEFRDYYADDPDLAPSRSGFYNSIKSENTVEMNANNQSDTELREVYLEYSASGLFDDTETVDGAPYEYRLEDTPVSEMVTNSVSLASIPQMNGKVSGVPSLEEGDQIRVIGTVNNGIKKYYPTRIANTSVTATDNVNDTISGTFAANSTWDLGGGPGTTHTFLADQYSEFIAGSATPYDVFAPGAAQNATTLNNYRIDTKSLALAQTDSTTRYLSPSNKPGDSTPWDQQLSGGAGGYDMTAHQSTLDIGTGPYRQNIQVLNGRYQYPTGNYTNYNHAIDGAGPDYTNGTTNFPTDDYRYVDIDVGYVDNETYIIVQFNGANWNDKQPAELSMLLRVDGSSSTGGDGWLNIWEAYQGGNPTGSSSPVGAGMARDAYDYSSAESSDDGQRRRVTFGSAPKIGDVILRIGIRQGSGHYFESVTLEW